MTPDPEPGGPCPEGLTAERAMARPGDRSGAYLTDEVFLYRVVGQATSRGGQMVELEDCYRLDVVRVPVRELRARRLRIVTPAPAVV